MNFHVIIPARLASTRLPGKLLMDIDGQSVLERVYRQVLQSEPASVVIATDAEQIAAHARHFGADVQMTSVHHPSGTDRIAEVVAARSYAENDIIVNVQGDEPFIPPVLVSQVARILYGNEEIPMATLCWPVESLEQLHDKNVVKVVRDKYNNALYFSRSPIPAHRDNPQSMTHSFRHIGLYAYRVNFLQELVGHPPCAMEECEALEQLRVLWTGHKLRVDVACALPTQDINTIEDLQRART